MRSVLLLLTISAVFYLSCSNNTTNDTTATKKEKTTEDPSIQKGLELVAGNDCFGCHKVVEPLTGPAYQDVAERYKDSTDVTDSLAARIIHGSSGHWGEMQMTPHPNLSHEDAKMMVHYILSLKK